MRAPEFWRDGGLLAGLLAPAALVYAAAARWQRQRVRPQRAPLQVVCVGNLVAGGAGKTPVALALGAMLRAQGVDAWFLTRGYGGRRGGPRPPDPPRAAAPPAGAPARRLA